MRKQDKSRSKPSSHLRCKAEKKLQRQTEHVGTISAEEARQLVQELRVHQAELEIQNEDLRRAQMELAESRDRYFDLFDFAPVAYFTFDEKGLIHEVNLAGSQLLGVERRFLIHRRLGKFIHHDFESAFFRHRQEALSTKTKQTCELKMVKKDGAVFYANLDSIAVQKAASDTSQIRTAITDLTERKHLEAQLIQSEKLASVGTLAYGIAHEFNNILHGIMSASELGISGSSPQETKECFEIIAQSCQRGASIAESLLMVGAERRMKKQPVNVGQTLLNVLALTRGQLEKANIKVVEEINDVPLIFCDPGQLSEVFLNMITNARDAMLSAGGILTVRVQRQEDDIQIMFQDTGTGIPEDIKGRIFDPFVTTKGPLGQSEVPGTGLGLFVCHGIIKGYDGRIESNSSWGKGSTFTISVPISKNFPPDSVRQVQDKRPKKVLKSLNILLVDDEKSICKVLKKFLESKGHQVTTSLTARKGLDCFTKGKFDLVLSDLGIPDMNGIKLIEKIRERDQQAQIIILTGHVEKSKEQEAKNAGADEVLIKPLSNTILYDTIVRVSQRT